MEARPSMAHMEVVIEPPLADCFRHCEVECVRECCGIDAIATESGLIAGWAARVGPDVARQALGQLESLIAVIADRSFWVSCQFLNHCFIDETGRDALLAFLDPFRMTLRVDR